MASTFKELSEEEMKEQQNTYIQYPQQPMMPVAPPYRGEHRRLNNGNMRLKSMFPRWVTQYSISVYIIVLALVSMMYNAYMLPWYYMFSGIVSVGIFFLYGSTLTNVTSIDRMHSDKRFEKRIVLISFLVRFLWVMLIYAIFMQNYGNAFGFEKSDARYYDDLGQFVAKMIDNGDFHFYTKISKFSGSDDIADMGYGVYVGFIYWLTGNSIIVVRLLKCLLSTWTVILIYRLAKRNFDSQVARIAAIFCALWPNFWYYCGVHLKETEMVFLAVLFVEQAEQMLRSRQFTAWKVVPVLLIGAAMLTFRTPLALVAFLSLIFSVVMSSSRVMHWGKRIIVGILAVLLLGVTVGNQIEEQSKKLFDTARSDSQVHNMEWRSHREHGNAFAKYAGKSVFAPLIFTIPFPTIIEPFRGDDAQDVQELLNGGNYVKNIISFFTIFAMFLLLLTGRWREHLLPLSFMLGYLIVLTMSTFAQSERFHQPVMPFEFMFAAYGLSVAVTKLKFKRWFTYWCGLMFLATIVWSWFKLAGRGLV